MPETLTEQQQQALDYTIGRATNEDLERAVGVHFKSEMEDPDGSAGPVFLIVPKSGATVEEKLDADALFSRMREFDTIPVRKGGDAEWYSERYAELLAEALGVPLWSL